MEEALRKQQGSDLLFKGLEAKRSGNFELALQFYEQSRQVYPKEPNIYKNASKVLLGLGRLDEALKYTIIRAQLMLERQVTRLDLMMVADRYAVDPYYSFNLRFGAEELIRYCVQDKTEWQSVLVDNDNLSVAGIAFLLHPIHDHPLASIRYKSLGELQRSPCRQQYQRMALGLAPTGATFGPEEWRAIDVLGFCFVHQNIMRYPFKAKAEEQWGLPMSNYRRASAGFTPDSIENMLKYYLDEGFRFDFSVED